MNSPGPATPNSNDYPSCPSVGWTIFGFIFVPLINIIQLVHTIVYLNKCKKADIEPGGRAWTVIIISLVGIIVLPILWFFFILYPSVFLDTFAFIPLRA